MTRSQCWKKFRALNLENAQAVEAFIHDLALTQNSEESDVFVVPDAEEITQAFEGHLNKLRDLQKIIQVKCKESPHNETLQDALLGVSSLLAPIETHFNKEKGSSTKDRNIGSNKKPVSEDGRKRKLKFHADAKEEDAKKAYDPNRLDREARERIILEESKFAVQHKHDENKKPAKSVFRKIVAEKDVEKKKAADEKLRNEAIAAEAEKGKLKELEREKLEQPKPKSKKEAAQVVASNGRFDPKVIAPILETKFHFSAKTAKSASEEQHEKTEQKLQYSFEEASGKLVLSGSAKDWETMMKAMEASFDASKIPQDQRCVVINMPDANAHAQMINFARARNWHIEGDEENQPPVSDSKADSKDSKWEEINRQHSTANSIGRASFRSR